MTIWQPAQPWMLDTALQFAGDEIWTLDDLGDEQAPRLCMF